MVKTKIKLSDFPGAFWAANTMEIFERMAWYGFFAVSSLYISGSVEDGGLGFSHEDRGVLQGVVTFFLYLFPVVSGTLADRYGFIGSVHFLPYFLFGLYACCSRRRHF